MRDVVFKGDAFHVPPSLDRKPKKDESGARQGGANFAEPDPYDDLVFSATRIFTISRIKSYGMGLFNGK